MATPKNTKIDYVLDATNICNWHVANKGVRTSKKNEHNSSVSLDTLLKLVNALIDENRTFQCIFDANTSYNLPDEEKSLYNILLSEYKDNFYQVTGGIKADSFVLSIASNYGSRVVSNDNFSDYQGEYPWVKREANPQRLFKGGIPMIAGMKHLVLPELGINFGINETTQTLFNEMRRKLGYGSDSNAVDTGEIKTFDKQKGIGFIALKGGEEIYFNRSQLNVEEGDKVELKVKINDENKTYASDIHLVKEEFKEPKIWTEGAIFEGTVDWYDNNKGYGAIHEGNSDKKDKTIFFFKAGLEPGLNPEPEMKVVYEKKVNKKGPYASSIKEGEIKDFILLKEYIPGPAPSKQPEKTAESKESTKKLNEQIETLNALLWQYEQLLKVNRGKVYSGKITYLDDLGGSIQLESSKAEMAFYRKQVNIKKSELKKNLIVEFAIDFTEEGLLVKNIIKKKIADNQSTGKSQPQVKASKPIKEPEPASSNQNLNAPKKKDNRANNPNKSKGASKNQPKGRGKNENKASDPKGDKSQTNNNPNNNPKDNKKGQDTGKTKQEKKSKQPDNGKPKTPAPVNKSKNSKATDKNHKKGNNNEFDYSSKVANKQKMFYWAKEKSGKNKLVAIRFNPKKSEIERWILDESNLKKNWLEKNFKQETKLDPRTLPKDRIHEVLPFKTTNLIPSGFKSSHKSFIGKVSKEWTLQIKRTQQYELLKKEITGIYKEVKQLKVYDGKLNDKAMSIVDKIMDFAQAGKLSEEHALNLRKGINQCYDSIRKLPKKKK